MSEKDFRNDQASQRSKASARPHAPSPQTTPGQAERRPIVEVKGLGVRVDIAIGEAENPYYSRAHKESATNPRKIPVARNLNESPLVRLFGRGTIDERQALAGNRFRYLVEKLEGGLRSSSFIQERVDGGSRPDAFSEGRADASRRLRDAATHLDPRQYAIVRAVCAEGISLNELARRNRTRPAAAREALKGALDRLAEVWGYGKPKQDA